MTYAPIIGSCLSLTSKVPHGDAERSGEGEPTLWIGRVTEKKPFDTSFCSPSSETPWETAGAVWLLAPSDYGTTFGNQESAKIEFIHVDGEGHKGDKAECQELRPLVGTKHFLTILLDCQVLSNLTQLKSSE